MTTAAEETSARAGYALDDHKSTCARCGDPAYQMCEVGRALQHHLWDCQRAAMPEPQPVHLTAFLMSAEYAIVQAPKDVTDKTGESLRSAATYYAPRFLAAFKKMLAQHQPGRIVILGALCPEHENHRHFSITSTEAAGITACPDCAANVYVSCAGCGPQKPLDLCQVRTAITRELLRGGETDA